MPGLEGVYLDVRGPLPVRAHPGEKLGLPDAFDALLPTLPKEERDIPGVSRGPRHRSRLPVSGKKGSGRNGRRKSHGKSTLAAQFGIRKMFKIRPVRGSNH